MSTIAIGRRTVDEAIFIEAINNAKNLRDAARRLEFNEKVGTTIRNIKEAAELLGLDISRFVYNRDFSVVDNTRKYSITPENYIYYEAFEDYAFTAFKRDSLPTYQSYTKKFLESLGDKKLTAITGKDIEDYCGDKKMAAIVVKSFLKYIIKENSYCFGDDCTRDLMRWMIANS